mmetsp:Transcript_3981/g.9749  ORF Transcript_3981/g.9749 Transcript_3981/m.9749 type:complete len:223 (-) Transcript_3981:148-816(-)
MYACLTSHFRVRLLRMSKVEFPTEHVPREHSFGGAKRRRSASTTSTRRRRGLGVRLRASLEGGSTKVIHVSLTREVLPVALEQCLLPLSLLLILLLRVVPRDLAQQAQLLRRPLVLYPAALLLQQRVLLDALLERRLGFQQPRLLRRPQDQRGLLALAFLTEADRAQEADPSLRRRDLRLEGLRRALQPPKRFIPRVLQHVLDDLEEGLRCHAEACRLFVLE